MKTMECSYFFNFTNKSLLSTISKTYVYFLTDLLINTLLYFTNCIITFCIRLLSRLTSLMSNGMCLGIQLSHEQSSTHSTKMVLFRWYSFPSYSELYACAEDNLLYLNKFCHIDHTVPLYLYELIRALALRNLY